MNYKRIGIHDARSDDFCVNDVSEKRLDHFGDFFHFRKGRKRRFDWMLVLFSDSHELLRLFLKGNLKVIISSYSMKVIVEMIILFILHN